MHIDAIENTMHAELLISAENIAAEPTTSTSLDFDIENTIEPNFVTSTEKDTKFPTDPKHNKKITIQVPNEYNENRQCTRRNSDIKLIKNGNHPSSSSPSTSNRIDNNPANFKNDTRVYATRYIVLAIFVMLSASNAMQWIEYSIIAHIIKHYYNVEFWQVDWTSMIYMLTYMILVFPGSWFLDRFGLRRSIMIGALGNCIGAWLKILSTSPERFWLTFTAQTIVGASQVFILGIPSRLAAVWFGKQQVSTACAVGVFGNQLGIAIGFVLPPWLVHMGTTEKITSELRTLFIGSAAVNTLVLAFIIFFFRERPPHPPSLAQARAIEESVDHEFCVSLKKLVFNRNYMILLFSYGINVGVFYAVSTLLSQMILYYHSDAQESVGTIGLLIVVSGMLGSVVCGYALDRFHQYKLTTILVYLLSFVGMLSFTFSLGRLDLWIIFVVAAILGFFMTGYLPLGFEFAAELTFPIAEGTTSGFLNAVVQAFGVAMTSGMSKVMQNFSIFWANLIMSIFLFVGLSLTALIKADLRRQNAHKNVSYKRSEAEISATAVE